MNTTNRTPCFLRDVTLDNVTDVQNAIETALNDADAHNDELYEQMYDVDNDDDSTADHIHPELIDDSAVLFMMLLPEQIEPVRAIARQFALRFVNVKNLPM